MSDRDPSFFPQEEPSSSSHPLVPDDKVEAHPLSQGDSSQQASFARHSALWFARAVVLFTTIGTICAWLATVWWPLELASHFRVQYILGFGVGALLFGLFLRLWVTLFCIVMALPHLWLVIPFSTPSLPTPPTQKVRGLLANVSGSNTHHAGMLRVIKEENPDILLLLEVTPKWKASLQPLRKTYPHHLLRPRDDNFGAAFFSRLPTSSLRIRTLGEAQVNSVEAIIKVGAHTVTLLGSHPVPPISGRAAALRNEQLRTLGETMKQMTGPRILWGDFNTSPWSPYFRQLLDRSGLRDSRLGFGLQTSWPTQLPLLLTPIDHVLVSSQIHITQRRIGPDIGSDHYPVLFTFFVTARRPPSPSR